MIREGKGEGKKVEQVMGVEESLEGKKGVRRKEKVEVTSHAHGVVSSPQECQEAGGDGGHAGRKEQSPSSSFQPGYHTGSCVHGGVAPATVQITIL